MTLKNLLTKSFLAATTLGAGTLFALPTIDQTRVTVSQNPRSRVVTVQYVLTGDPAVVTVDFQTNNVSAGVWESIGGEKYARVAGDVNRVVTDIGTVRTITWQPKDEDAWPNQHITGGNVRAVVKAWATNAPPPYMIVALDEFPGKTWYYPSAEAVPYGITNDLYKTTRMAFRLVPASHVQWRMGAPSTETGQTVSTRETPHLVTFTNDYYLGVYPVTQKQNTYFASISQAASPSTVTNNMPATATYPVDSIIWTNLRGWHVAKDTGNVDGNGADSYFLGNWPKDGHRLSTKSGIYKARQVMGIPSLDLPTEAMWEYACRAGTNTATYAGNLAEAGSPSLDPVLGPIAWYAVNAGGVTHPVGTKEPNRWGFYDMLGNVLEWCLDKCESNLPISGDDAIDPPGVENDALYPYRVLRGGAYESSCNACRCAYRTCKQGHDSSGIKTFGYRLSCEAIALK